VAIKRSCSVRGNLSGMGAVGYGEKKNKCGGGGGGGGYKDKGGLYGKVMDIGALNCITVRGGWRGGWGGEGWKVDTYHR